MKEIVVLNGIHGSGKSTLGEIMLNCGYLYFPEIGREVRRKVQYTVFEQIEDFDKEVMRQELNRDSIILGSNGRIAIETWHPGNIAYAMIRNLQVAKEYKHQFANSLKFFEPTFITLDISRQTFIDRASENTGDKNMEDLWQFYQEIRRNTFQIYQEFDLNYHVIDANKELDEVAREANIALKEQGFFDFEIERKSKEY